MDTVPQYLRVRNDINFAYILREVVGHVKTIKEKRNMKSNITQVTHIIEAH